MSASDEQARSTADMVARRSYGKLVAFLSARTRDVAQAEDALAEAFASALADRPRNGCPANPEAWLLTAARRKMIDGARRRRSSESASGDLRLVAEDLEAAAAGRCRCGHPGSSSRFDVRFSASGHRIRHPCAAHSAGHFGTRCKDDRFGVSRFSGDHGQAPRAGQG